MKKLVIGVIGAGGVSQVEHIPDLLHPAELFDLCVVADPSSSARSLVSRSYGVPTVPDARSLLELPLDAVVIVSPDALHLGHVSASLAAGKHVFCEKPLCYAASDIADFARQRDAAAPTRRRSCMM